MSISSYRGIELAFTPVSSGKEVLASESFECNDHAGVISKQVTSFKFFSCVSAVGVRLIELERVGGRVEGRHGYESRTVI